MPKELDDFIDSMVDIMESSIVINPLVSVLDILCEQARTKVLSTTVEKVEPVDKFEQLMKVIWLADIDSKKGVALFQATIRDLPAPLLRYGVAMHFLYRIFWSHWKHEDRLLLLDATNEALKPFKVNIDKGKVTKLLGKE